MSSHTRTYPAWVSVVFVVSAHDHRGWDHEAYADRVEMDKDNRVQSLDDQYLLQPLSRSALGPGHKHFRKYNPHVM